MQRWARAALSGVAVLGLAAGLLAIGTAVGAPPQTSGEPAVTAPAGDPLTQRISALQTGLDRVPGNYTAWAELGYAYLTQARLTADPGLYARAEGAFDKALALRPKDNDTALTGLAALAAARHEFAEALELTDRSLAANDFSPTTYAVRTDALVELGRYDEARVAVQRLLDLQPAGVDSLTRASYALELRGQVEPARLLLEQAAEAASSPADVAFAQYYLGELAWNGNDLAAADAAYEAGLAADPTFLPLVAGRAKVLAAKGDTAAAASEYRRVVEQLPQPEFLVAFGELLEATGQRDAAQEQYAVVRATQRLFAAAGQDVETELALFEADHGTPAAAVASARKAYAKRPDSIFTQDAYAWALHAAGRSAEALPIARRAVRLGLQSPAMHYRHGAIEAAAGNMAEAKAALQKALALNPAFSPLHAPRAQELLESLT
jgi:tetratricopeptide (TPR) repeat protein